MLDVTSSTHRLLLAAALGRFGEVTGLHWRLLPWQSNRVRHLYECAGKPEVCSSDFYGLAPEVAQLSDVARDAADEDMSGSGTAGGQQGAGQFPCCCCRQNARGQNSESQNAPRSNPYFVRGIVLVLYVTKPCTSTVLYSYENKLIPEEKPCTVRVRVRVQVTLKRTFSLLRFGRMIWVRVGLGHLGCTSARTPAERTHSRWDVS